MTAPTCPHDRVAVNERRSRVDLAGQLIAEARCRDCGEELIAKYGVVDCFMRDEPDGSTFTRRGVQR